MPRVTTRTKSNRGATRSCHRCGRTINPGEKVHSYSFRYGGTYYHCEDHYPRASELTQSKMAEVYAAQEGADLSACETVQDVREAVEAVAEVAQQVAEEYRDAAEPFGGEGENAERADGLEGWADELASFDPEEPDADEDALRDAVVEKLLEDGFSRQDDDWAALLAARMEDAREANDDAQKAADALEAARSEAEELIGNCPL